MLIRFHSVFDGVWLFGHGISGFRNVYFDPQQRSRLDEYFSATKKLETKMKKFLLGTVALIAFAAPAAAVPPIMPFRERVAKAAVNGGCVAGGLGSRLN